MKLSITMLLVAACLLQLGNASEISNRALKATREVKDDLKRLNTFLKFYAFMYGAELNEDLDNAENQYKEQFNQEVHSVLDEIKTGIAQQKGSVPNKCYEAAKARFDQLNVTSSKVVEQCSVSKENGVDPDKVLDSIATLVGHGTKLYKHVGKLEKEVEKSNEIDLKSFEDKRVPAIKASAEECNEKELADVHVIALKVRENAFNCINQA